MMTTNPIARTIFAGWDVALVEDDPSSLDIAQMMLRHYGAKVHSALNGQEGVLLVQAVMPKIIITDISMPIMDGWELIAQIKAEPRTAHIPIIALTAHAMPGDRERAIAAGCHNYLSKPLMPSTFIRELVGLLIDLPALGLQV